MWIIVLLIRLAFFFHLFFIIFFYCIFLSETYRIYDYDWSGTNVSVSKNNDEITVSNTVRGTSQCILHELDGRTPSFVFEFDSFASGSGKHGVYVKQNGSYVSSDDSTTQIFPNNTSKEVILKLENNTVSSTANNDNRSTTNNVISARNYQRIYCKDGAYITNLKIKSL